MLGYVDMKPIWFVSANRKKFVEAKSVFLKYDMNVSFFRVAVKEIQHESIEEIANEKSRYAFGKILQPVVVEDDGLFIHKLNDFPGQYSSFVFKTIGNKGILDLLKGYKNRSACFVSVISFFDGRICRIFIGRTRGKIARNASEGGWGFDPIFIPEGCEMTFGELQLQKMKIVYSHRSKAVGKFARWYNETYL
jgi:XTP/dITP diphosphohydrolase